MVTSQRSIGIDNAKTLYDTIRGDDTNWLLFLGGTETPASELNSIDDDQQVWETTNFLQKVRSSDVEVVAKRVDWRRGQVFYPYRSSGIPAGETGAARNYYAVTDDNEVYVCMGSNEKNRSDLNGLSSSTVKPTRTNDNQVLTDGYRWKFLYKIDLVKSKFKTTNNIPVPDINEYDAISSSISVEDEAKRRGCGNNVGETGACCFYHKENEVEAVTGTVFKKGDFDFCMDNALCSKCFTIARKMNREFTFTKNTVCSTGPTGTNGPCSSTIPILSGYERALNNAKYFSPNSNNKLQAEVYRDAKANEGVIHNAFIDLSGLSESDLTISEESPEITLSSLSGTGAKIVLTTYAKGQSYVVDGIKVVSGGSGYNDVICVDSAGDLEDRITFSLDYQGGLFADPRRVLNAAKVMVKVVVRTDKISENFGTDQTTFKRYGLLRDVEAVNDTANFIAGSQTNRDQLETFSNLHKIRIANKGGGPSIATDAFSLNDDLTNKTDTSSANLTKIASLQTSKSKSLKTTATSRVASFSAISGSAADIEIISTKDTPFVSGDTIANNSSISDEYNFSTTISSPTVKKFTGKVVSSNSTDITVTTQPREVSFSFLYTLGNY